MFLKLRRKLINWLAGEDIIVIINTKIYDWVLVANGESTKSCLFRRNKVHRLEETIQNELRERLELARQGVSKQGEAYVLDYNLMYD